MILALVEEHSLSQSAVEIARPFGFPVTNSMLVTWIVALALIVFARFATRSMKQVPSGSQNFVEWLVESLYNFLEGILGPHLVRRTFWFFASIFIFILATNWVGLIPGVGRSSRASTRPPSAGSASTSVNARNAASSS